MYKTNKGFEYEKIAQRYLSANGYRILAVNFFCRFGEIDIIAKKNEYLIFIEVKGRKNISAGYPREYVTKSKVKKLLLTVKYYMMVNNYADMNCRFDVLEVIYDAKKINHIKNAIEMEGF